MYVLDIRVNNTATTYANLPKDEHIKITWVLFTLWDDSAQSELIAGSLWFAQRA